MIRLAFIVVLSLPFVFSCQSDSEQEKSKIQSRTDRVSVGVKTESKGRKVNKKASDHDKIHVPAMVIIPPPKVLPDPGPRPEPYPDPIPEPYPDPIVEPEPYVKQGPVIYDYADKMPEYPGGQTELFKFITTKMKYPDVSKELEVEGNVYVKFVVNESGKVSNPVIVKGVQGGKDLEKEALRVVSLFPDWIPGEHHGEKVSVYQVIPIRFRLDK